MSQQLDIDQSDQPLLCLRRRAVSSLEGVGQGSTHLLIQGGSIEHGKGVRLASRNGGSDAGLVEYRRNHRDGADFVVSP